MNIKKLYSLNNCLQVSRTQFRITTSFLCEGKLRKRFSSIRCCITKTLFIFSLNPTIVLESSEFFLGFNIFSECRKGKQGIRKETSRKLAFKTCPVFSGRLSQTNKLCVFLNFSTNHALCREYYSCLNIIIGGSKATECSDLRGYISVFFNK